MKSEMLKSLIKETLFSFLLKEDPAKPPHVANPQSTSQSDGDSEAAEQAHKLGLTAAGWGYWADKNGQKVAKTVDGKLVKIEPGDGEGRGSQNQAPPKGNSPLGVSAPDKGVPKVNTPDPTVPVGSHNEPVPGAQIGLEKDLKKYGGDAEKLAQIYKMTLAVAAKQNPDSETAKLVQTRLDLLNKMHPSNVNVSSEPANQSSAVDQIEKQALDQDIKSAAQLVSKLGDGSMDITLEKLHTVEEKAKHDLVKVGRAKLSGQSNSGLGPDDAGRVVADAMKKLSMIQSMIANVEDLKAREEEHSNAADPYVGQKW